MERLFDTGSVPANRQLEYWADHVCKAFTNLQISKASSGSGGFVGKLAQRSFGPISIASALAQDSEVQLTRSEISKATEEVLLLHLQYKGHSTLLHAGTERLLNKGDIEICDCTQPYHLSLHGRNQRLHEMLVVRIPLALLSSRIANVHMLAGAFVAGNSDLGSLVSHFIANVWERRAGIDNEAAEQLGCQIVDLVMLAFNNGALQETRESSIRSGHLIRMKRFIDTRLSDNSLGPADVARAACISQRYVHLLFASEETTVFGYITDKRLARCEEMLLSAQHGNLTISEIAHMWGFKDASHFGHVFKRKHGVSPTDYRRSRP